jgi:hypothetical protein
MSHFMIEKGVPYTPGRGKPKTGVVAELLQMEIGDSFLIPDDFKTRTSVYNAIKHIRNYMGKENMYWVSKKWDDTHIRFWRVS